MLNYHGVTDAAPAANELGVVICKVCGEVMHTLPTNGYKKISGICGKPECRGTDREAERE
jgi:hypothetical protein